MASACFVLLAVPVGAADLVEVAPLTDRIVLLHFDEGYVEHHRSGHPRSEEKVVISPLDVAAASKPTSYEIASSDDPAYRRPRAPVKVHRKSKGTDFAWFVDAWIDNRAVNTRPDHTKEHWVYLVLPEPLKPGKTYTIRTGGLAANGASWTLDQVGSRRSEAVHASLLGYTPDAPAKYAFVSQWMGDGGSLALADYAGRAFRLVDLDTGKPAFSGRLAFRAPATLPETFHASDTPPVGNFQNAEVYECDFSAFGTPGRYAVEVEGIGRSFPFRIDREAFREAFRTVARGLYHNRSGIELKAPFTEFARPAPHHPKLTPGFKGRLIYTTVRFTEWGSEGGDPKLLMAHSKGPIDSWGWYQDAGDWDGYYSHLRVAQELLFAHELAPNNFTDGELNIPESGNGIPDILDEAAWLPRFLHRLRHELVRRKFGTGGVGLRVAGDGFGSDEKDHPDGKKTGRGSWEDTDRTWAVSGEDPWSTYRYAGAAAHLALRLATLNQKDPEGVDWSREAREAYAWAQKNTRKGDDAIKEPWLGEPRTYAAAALFRLTGRKEYEAQFAKDTADIGPDTRLWDEGMYGPMLYALDGGKTPQDQELKSRIRSAVLATADDLAGVADRRALRWAGNFSMPMLIGQQTTPWVLQLAVGRALAATDFERARRYTAALHTTAGYFLGANPLNMTWVTGLGPRHPAHVFHMDAWYNGKGGFHPGIIPYGPWRKEKDTGQGPWDVAWPHATVYPAIDHWPGSERWFDNRCSPLNAEFTIHQNTAPAAAIFGLLCAPRS